ncbi:MAG TPA: hypothetical protein VD997_02430 [Phycisphaerales bacterium]|nr:hypothetical protein [Phycisphaerales bacterium]
MRPAAPTRHEVEAKPPISGVTRLPGNLPEDPVALWNMVTEACQKQHRMRILVGSLKLVTKDEHKAVLEVSDEMRTAAQSAERDLCTLLSIAWGQNLAIELKTASGEKVEPLPKPAAATTSPGAAPNPPATPTTPISDHPLIKQATELFGAKIISTQPRKKQGE